MRYRTRLSSAVVAALLGAALLAATPPPAGAADEYSDIPVGGHREGLTVLASQGVFAGTDCSPGRICPHTALKRWTMAVWLTRAVDGRDPQPVTSTRFSDVDADDDWWAPYAERLAELGITQGCATGRFCPDDNVTRKQMATFLVRAFDMAPSVPFGFTDLGSTVHASNINALAAARITAGCSVTPLRYCPNQAVTRAQMATFLARALDLIDLPAAPRGSQIAFVSNRDGDNEIYTMHQSGAQQQQITDNTQSDHSPIWSPAAPHILYTANIDGTTQIFTINTATDRPPRQLTFNGGHSPAWSPDGTQIAFIRSTNVQVINANSTNLRTIASYYCPTGVCASNSYKHFNDPIWSPDGRELLVRTHFKSCRYTSCSSSSRDVRGKGLALVPASGGGIRSITLFSRTGADVQFSSISGPSDPALAPSGSRIAYARNGIALINYSGGNFRQLTDHGIGPVWSPDSTRIAFIGLNNIWVVHVDGSSIEQITFDGARNPTWSPDGTRIAFDSARDGDFEIYVIDADGTNLQQLTYNSDEDYDPDW